MYKLQGEILRSFRNYSRFASTKISYISVLHKDNETLLVAS